MLNRKAMYASCRKCSNVVADGHAIRRVAEVGLAEAGRFHSSQPRTVIYSRQKALLLGSNLWMWLLSGKSHDIFLEGVLSDLHSR
ncbi:hypothetical protein DPMN_150778 [Dreissena polymorpha]|uniref:Uncharacterized protein n=1 Tax=Dreissena polymorpha TaxID=45954 RepID=A0A9D4FF74_DREPO|nr:hypothetical protein DPMN_150778 [Dreissena polymorpha]